MQAASEKLVNARARGFPRSQMFDVTAVPPSQLPESRSGTDGQVYGTYHTIHSTMVCTIPHGLPPPSATC